MPADKVKEEEEEEEMPDAQEVDREEREENMVREKNVGSGTPYFLAPSSLLACRQLHQGGRGGGSYDCCCVTGICWCGTGICRDIAVSYKQECYW